MSRRFRTLMILFLGAGGVAALRAVRRPCADAARRRAAATPDPGRGAPARRADQPAGPARARRARGGRGARRRRTLLLADQPGRSAAAPGRGGRGRRPAWSPSGLAVLRARRADGRDWRTAVGARARWSAGRCARPSCASQVARAETRARVRAAYVGTQLALARVEAAAQREALVAKLLDAVQRARRRRRVVERRSGAGAAGARAARARARVDATLAAADALARLRAAGRAAAGADAGAGRRGAAAPPPRAAERCRRCSARAQAQRAELAALASGVDEIDADIVRLRREAIPSPTLFVELQRDLPGQIFVGGGAGDADPAVAAPAGRAGGGARRSRARARRSATLVERDVALEVERAFQAEARAARDDAAARSRGAAGGGGGGDADDRGVAGRQVRSVPAAADLARRERGAAAAPRDAGSALGVVDRARSRGGGAMKMSKRSRCWSSILVPALVVVGRAGAAAAAVARGDGRQRRVAAAAGGRRRGRWRSRRRRGRRTRCKVAPAELAQARRATSRSSARSRSTRITSRWSGRWSPGRDLARWRPASAIKVQARSGDRGDREQRGRPGARRSGRRRKARFAAADANLQRETDLAEKKISSARERELAHAQWVTEQAGVRAAIDAAARHRPVAGGHRRRSETRDQGGRVQMRAPIGGTVIERKVTLGQAVERATDAFKIADTSHVWVSLDLYEKDLSRVHVGQEVEMRTDALPGEIVPRPGRVHRARSSTRRRARRRCAWSSRTRRARCTPGQLVTARIVADPTAGDGRGAGRPAQRRSSRSRARPVVFVQGRRRRSSGATCCSATSGGDRSRSAGASTRASWSRSTARSCSRASSCDEPGRHRRALRPPARRRAGDLGGGVRGSRWRRSATCRSTPSPTSPTRRSRS